MVQMNSGASHTTIRCRMRGGCGTIVAMLGTHTPNRQRHRLTGGMLFAAGMLPSAAAFVVVGSFFALPNIFNAVFNIFVPVGVDAPDHWAVGLTRMVWLYVWSGSIGVGLSCVGLWLVRRAA